VGTANMISLAKKLKVKKFIYSSSMAVYGNGNNVSEESFVNPISFYGVSKYTGELQTKLLLEHNNIPYTIFRLFATYGSGQDLTNPHQGVVSIYLNQILKLGKVEMTGSKKRIRELIHVDDVVNALLLGLSTETDNEREINQISSELNTSIEIKEYPGYEGDQTNITGNTTKLRKLGWEPKINLSQGVKEFINNI
jgi:UDP-glucose 4-epimerase